MRLAKIQDMKDLIQNFHDEIFRKTNSIEENSAYASLNLYEALMDETVSSPFKMVHRLRRRLFVGSRKNISKENEKNSKKRKSVIKIQVETCSSSSSHGNEEMKNLIYPSDFSSTSCENFNEGEKDNGKISINSLELETCTWFVARVHLLYTHKSCFNVYTTPITFKRRRVTVCKT